MVGFHWTKQHPDRTRRGLRARRRPGRGRCAGSGKALLLTGLRHLRAAGQHRGRALRRGRQRPSRRALPGYGFSTASRDVMYAQRPDTEHAQEMLMEAVDISTAVEELRSEAREHRAGPRAPAGRPVPGPRAVLAGLQQPGARPGQGPAPGAAAGAGQVPGHLRHQPGRVLHGPGRRAEAPDRGRGRGPDGQRADAARGALGDPEPDPGAGRRAGPGVRPRRSGPSWPQQGIEILRWDQLDRRREGPDGRAVRRADLPGAHPAGRRPVAPVPLHLRPVDQPGRPGPQPRDRHPAVRPGQGADACCPGSSRWPRAGTSPWRT